MDNLQMKDMTLNVTESKNLYENLLHPQEKNIHKRDMFLASAESFVTSYHDDGSMSVDIPNLNLNRIEKRELNNKGFITLYYDQSILAKGYCEPVVRVTCSVKDDSNVTAHNIISEEKYRLTHEYKPQINTMDLIQKNIA